METQLRYIEASLIGSPAGKLDDALVVSPSKATLGKLEGVLVDPALRRVQFYVIESGRPTETHHHYLLPLMPARLDTNRRSLEVDFDTGDLDQLDDVEPDTLPRFSDEDLITAMFASPTT